MPQLTKPQLHGPQPIKPGTSWQSIWQAFKQVHTFNQATITDLQRWLTRLYQTLVPFQLPPIQVPSGNAYTVQANDVYLAVPAGANAAQVVNLPSATGSGRTLIIEKTDSGLQPVALTPSGSDTIDGASILNLLTQYEVAWLTDEAPNLWHVTARSQPLRLPSNASIQSPYTVQSSDIYLAVSTTAGAPTTLTLPPATGQGRVLAIEKIDANNQPVIVTPNGSDTINGASTYSLVGQYESIMLADEASGQWLIVANASVSQRWLPHVLTPAQAQAYTVLPSDIFLLVPGGLFATPSTITLPPASGSGRILLIMDYGQNGGGAGTLVHIIPGGSDLINFQSSATPVTLNGALAQRAFIDAVPGNWFFWVSP